MKLRYLGLLVCVFILAGCNSGKVEHWHDVEIVRCSYGVTDLRFPNGVIVHKLWDMQTQPDCDSVFIKNTHWDMTVVTDFIYGRASFVSGEEVPRHMMLYKYDSGSDGWLTVPGETGDVGHGAGTITMPKAPIGTLMEGTCGVAVISKNDVVGVVDCNDANPRSKK